MAMIYNCSDLAKKVKPPKDFLLRFDSEADGGDLDEQLKLFATQHNARIERRK